MKKKFYVTTAIAYPNSVPHLGHALEIVQADVVARFHRLLGKDVWFQTGTDEHGTKNWETAKKSGKEISKFLDEHVGVFKKLYKELNISYDYFIRTTDKKVHHPGVIELWKNLAKSGDIYKKNYQGLYCVGCETFKTEKELVDNKCPNHPKLNIKVVDEENYFFKLSKYKDELIKKIKSNEYEVVPKERKNEILSFLKDAKDISFSRPKTTLPWGIPVPGDDEQIMYVWCDALSNYITGIGYGRDQKEFNKIWPADVHIIGKDILRFHAAFWPAMLLSANIPLPKKLFVHGFILSGGTKMGKSSGNVVEPFSQIENYGSEIFKFYLVGTMPFESDGEYSEELLVERANTELVSNVANFIYRTLSFLNKNFDGKVIAAKDNKFTAPIESKFKEVLSLYENYKLRNAVNAILKISAIGNKYFQDNEPWSLIKKDKKKAHEVLSLCVNLVKDLVIVLKPILPIFSSEIEKQLNLKDLTFKDLNVNLKNHKIGDAEIILRKIEVVQSEEKPVHVDYSVKPEVEKRGVKVLCAVINGLSVKKKHEGLERLKKEVRNKLFSRKDVLDEYRRIDKESGLDIKKSPNSVINLINLVKDKGQLPQINTVVDVYNVVSVETGISMATHDVNKIKGDVSVRLSKDEPFVSLGNISEKLKAGEVVYADDEKVLGRFSKQCQQTVTDNRSRAVLLVAFGNKKLSDKEMRDSVKKACDLIIKFNNGSYKILGLKKENAFSKLNLKVAEVKEVKQHPDADKLYIMQIDVGEKKQLVAGLKEHYKPEELKGKKIVVVTNLQHAKLRGEKSEGMLLAAGDEKSGVGVLFVKNSKPGDSVLVEGANPNKKQITFPEFSEVKLVAKNGQAYFEGKPLKTSSETVKVDKNIDGKIS
ncbi:methionine--tRNA ligase [Candidatus Woesearchaeota archaeon]|nr:methionine--tRNA ligase [Candidatus Woesearchaeota archaeon]